MVFEEGSREVCTTFTYKCSMHGASICASEADLCARWSWSFAGRETQLTSLWLGRRPRPDGPPTSSPRPLPGPGDTHAPLCIQVLERFLYHAAVCPCASGCGRRWVAHVFYEALKMRASRRRRPACSNPSTAFHSEPALTDLLGFGFSTGKTWQQKLVISRPPRVSFQQLEPLLGGEDEPNIIRDPQTDVPRQTPSDINLELAQRISSPPHCDSALASFATYPLGWVKRRAVPWVPTTGGQPGITSPLTHGRLTGSLADVSDAETVTTSTMT